MHERKEIFGFASASQTTLSVTLIAISAILLTFGLTQLEGARPKQAKNEGQHLTQTEQPNALGDCVGAEPAHLLPAFAANYSCVSLGSVPGVPTNYGGLTLKYNDLNTFLIGGAANTSAGRIYQIGVLRDADMHITGFSGTATLYPNSGSTVGQFNDGVVFGPGNVLFIARYPANELEQTKPGSSAPDKVISLSPLGIASSVGSFGFVPAGFPGAGQMKLVSYNGGGWYAAAFSPDADGTYDITSVTPGPIIGGGPIGLAFVPPGSPIFPPHSSLIAQYSLGKIMTAPLDANGDPILTNQQDFIEQLSGAEGAFIDPLTGDFLFSTFGSGNRIIRVAGFTSLTTPTPTPTATVTPSSTPTPTTTPIPSATPTMGPPISGYNVWLRADAGTVLDASNHISTWQDQSGNGNHFTQPNPDQRPTVDVAGLGNQAVMRFDGVDDGLWGVETMNIGRPSTVFVVYEELSEGGYVLQNSTGGEWWVRSDGFYSNGWVRQASPAYNQEVVAVITNSTTGTTVHVNGSDWTHDASHTTPLPGRLALGGGNGRNYDPFNCLVAEVIVYDRVLSDAERQEVEAYLASRYILYDTRVATPAIDPPSQLVSGNTIVSMSVSTIGAEIRYTLDGSEPTTASPLYNTTLNVVPGTTVKARAFKAGRLASYIAQAVYTASATVPVATNGLQMWLRADAGVTLSEAGAVERWEDLSGHGNHVLQTTTSQQPALQPAGLGNQAAVRFDGVDDGLWGVEGMNIGRPSTVFVVYEELSEGGYVLQNSAGGEWWMRSDGFYSNGWVRQASPAYNQDVVAVMTNSTTGTTVHVNGSDWTHDASHTTPVPGRLALGGGNGRNYDPFNCLVAEVIVYDRVLSDAERQEVEAYLAARYTLYDTQVATPAINPPSQLVSGNTSVSMSVSTSGAEIRYTLDGSEPVAASPLYSVALNVAPGTTVKARAFKTGRLASYIAQAVYTPSANVPVATNGLQMWLRADAGVTLSEAGAVERWEDLSGHGNHVVQTTTSQQPALQPAGLGNQAAVRFDGVDDGLWGVEGMNIGRPSTVFVVYEALSEGGYVLQNSAGGEWWVRSDGYYSNGWVRQASPAYNQEVVAVITNSTAGTTVHVNGSNWTHDATLATPAPGRLALGGGNGRNYDPFNCLVAEVIVYDRVLSDAERQEVEAYLAGRYTLYDTQVATPAIDPPSQLVSGNVSVSMSVSTSGAEIHYTLDGSEPTVASPIYSAAFNVVPGTTVKARAFKSGRLASYIAQAVYTASATVPVATNGLQLWLRADAGVTLSEAGAVERWEDLSGHGNHVVQTTTSQQPALQPAGLGNQAAVRFDGVDDGLWGVETMNIGRPSTVFVVYEELSEGGYVLQNSTGGEWWVRSDGYYSNGWVRQASPAYNQEVVAVMTNSTTGTTVHVNGSDWTHDASHTTPLPGRLALGGGNGRNYDPFNCLVAEVIVYDRVLSDAERQEVEAYLAGRYTLYDTQVATPVINPPSQLVSGNVNVSMSVSTNGAEIRYTLDGSEPAAASPLYGATLSVAPGTTVKARAFKSGRLASYIAQAVYTASATVPVATNGLQMWLRADAGVTVNEAGAVERWEDLSGQGNHFLQNTPLQQPMLQPAGLGDEAAVRFDGVNDGLWGVETMNIGRPSTVFVVYEELSEGGYVLQNSAGGEWWVRSDGFYSDGWVRQASPAYNQEVVAVMTNGTTGTTVHVNGSDWTQDASHTTPAPGRLALGGGNGRNYDPFNCLVAEVIVYDRALSNSERQEVESYLTSRYALTEPRAALPVASAKSGIYFGAVDTTLSAATSGAVIRFTTDGSDPVATSPAYSSALRFLSDTTLKARAFATGMNSSSVLEERYLVREGLNPPRSWSGGSGGNGHSYRLAYYSYAITWDQAQAEALAMGGYLATLTSAEENAFVFEAVAQDSHAWNGAEGPFFGGFQQPASSEPGGGWQWVNGEGPFNFTAWGTGEPNNAGNEDVLQYRSHAAGWNDRARTAQSGVHSFIVEFNGNPEFNMVEAPVASPPVGTYDGDVAVTLESSTFGATIHYTLDGQVPTESSATYQGPILLSATTTIRARTYKAGMYPSQIVSFHYNIIPTLKPDLTIQNLQILGANPHSGSLVTLKWKEVNSGTAPATGAFYDSVRVRNATTGETLLDSIISPDPDPSLGVGEFRDRQYTLTLPDGSRSVGTLEFNVTADFLNGIYEGTPGGVAETNNSASITVDSTLADYPDLKVTSITAPPSGLLEQSVQLSWTVQNNGPGATTRGWHDQIYVSADATVGNDQAVGSFFYSSPLAPGASVTRTEFITLPAAGTGTRYLIVVTNSSHEVFELNFDNNAFVSAQSTQVSTYGVSVTVSQSTYLGGTVITLTGTTFDLVTGALVGNAPVTIRITHNGTVRIIYVTSDATGHFQVTFTPLPGEGGDYEVAADRPSVVGNVTQVQFSIIAMSVTPGQMAHRLLVGVAQTGHVDLRNLGTRPLTGIQATVVGAAANVSIQVSAPSELGPSASAPVTYTVTAFNDSILANPGAQIRFLSAEGAAVILPLNIEVVSLAPRLSATPAPLNAGMLRGSQRIVEFEISNTGGTPTGELTVALPSAPWLALVTPAQIPSLAPGERATVDLALTPAADLPLGPYTGTLVISSAATNLTIPFQFVAVSDLIGDVHVTVVDEFTFFAPGAPKVSGATVTLTDPVTNEIVRTATTAANGELSFTGVREGYYYIESRAAEHTSHRATLLVTASQVSEVSVFLARELISYTWIVTPTEIEDHYIFVLDVTFVTNVPAPVVTVEPASIDLSTLTDEVTQMNFTITNHGLIAAEHVNLSFEDDVVWQIIPLAGYIGTLAAQQSVVVPVTITRQSPARPAGFLSPRLVAPSSSPAPPPNGKCQINGTAGYDFQCGGSAQLRATPIKAYNGNGNCGALGGSSVPSPGAIQPPSNVTAKECAVCSGVKTETWVESPANRDRKILGVGENVRIEVSEGTPPVQWTVETENGGAVHSIDGRAWNYFAPSSPPSSAVQLKGRVLGSNTFCKLVFEIVAPSGVRLERYSLPRHTQGSPSSGFVADVYLLPEHVSFKNVMIRESTAISQATGDLIGLHGRPHPLGLWGAALKHVAGKGTLMKGTGDGVSVASELPRRPSYTPGIVTWDIPWEYKTAGDETARVFAIIQHFGRLEEDGSVTVTKGGESIESELEDPTSDFTRREAQ